MGDVNMFFCETGENGLDYSTAEIDIMIAGGLVLMYHYHY